MWKNAWILALLTLLVACGGGGGGGGGDDDGGGDGGTFGGSGEAILGITFDPASIRNEAPGNGATAGESDNWTITWHENGHQYTSFGDGMGFETDNSLRASLGVARIEGDKDDFSAFDIFKSGSASGGFGGKSLGILAIDDVLYLFRNGTGSEDGAFEQTELYMSTDDGFTFGFTGVAWTEDDFPGDETIFSPTFLQFGRGYAGARDDFVYIYANERTDSVSSDDWDVQVPGRISLFRVPKGSLDDMTAYEYFAGLDGGDPTWSEELEDREPAFSDSSNGIMRTSVSYNAGLGRYVLVTQQGSRFKDDGYKIGIYEAPEPWGPWSEVLLEDPQDVGPGLNTGRKTVYWNFSNKWLSSDGRSFVMVYTGPGPDEFGTIEGTFLTEE